MRWANLEQAQKTVERLLFGAAAAPIRKITKRIIITDGGDNTVFEWQRDKGITWPTPEDVRKYRESKNTSTGETETSTG